MIHCDNEIWCDSSNQTLSRYVYCCYHHYYFLKTRYQRHRGLKKISLPPRKLHQESDNRCSHASPFDKTYSRSSRFQANFVKLLSGKSVLASSAVAATNWARTGAPRSRSKPINRFGKDSRTVGELKARCPSSSFASLSISLPPQPSLSLSSLERCLASPPG